MLSEGTIVLMLRKIVVPGTRTRHDASHARWAKPGWMTHSQSKRFEAVQKRGIEWTRQE